MCFGLMFRRQNIATCQGPLCHILPQHELAWWGPCSSWPSAFAGKMVRRKKKKREIRLFCVWAEKVSERVIISPWRQRLISLYDLPTDHYCIPSLNSISLCSKTRKNTKIKWTFSAIHTFRSANNCHLALTEQDRVLCHVSLISENMQSQNCLFFSPGKQWSICSQKSTFFHHQTAILTPASSQSASISPQDIKAMFSSKWCNKIRNSFDHGFAKDTPSHPRMQWGCIM